MIFLIRDLRIVVFSGSLLALAVPTGSKSEELMFFSSPSRNINCAYSTNTMDNGIPSIRCDINQFKPTNNVTPPQSREEIEAIGRCTPARMSAFYIGHNGKASMFCPTDTTMGGRPMIIEYGNVWQKSGFVCKSEQNGMTCKNNIGHGFFLSRNLQKLF